METSWTRTCSGEFGPPSLSELYIFLSSFISNVLSSLTYATRSRSESSLFISPHRLILKTCGTTLNLLGVPRILEIAREHAGLPVVHRCFYSRKSFMFPERQLGPHREWKDEVHFLDGVFPNGSAYTVGRVNGDHWLLYMTGPPDCGSPMVSRAPVSFVGGEGGAPPGGDASMVDHTIEILMTQLAPEAREPFFTPDTVDEDSAGAHGLALSSTLGISDLFPRALTTLDAYAFTPCGYSSNALLKWTAPADGASATGASGEGYYTIHVTPEEGWSYASFECNVPLPATASAGAGAGGLPDLRTLVRRVVDIFRPGRITLTLFVSSAENSDAEDRSGESAIEAAQRAFRAALTTPLGAPAAGGTSDGAKGPPPIEVRRKVYKRTDKINYEFGGYDLAFASFEQV